MDQGQRHPVLLETNKPVVLRFNRDVIEQGNEASFRELMHPDFVHRTAAPGVPTGPEGMCHLFENVLRPALAGLTVEIHAQVAEGDLVTTRKTIRGTHRGALLGIAATQKAVAISVIDIVRVENGRYVEHWGLNTLAQTLEALRAG